MKNWVGKRKGLIVTAYIFLQLGSESHNQNYSKKMDIFTATHLCRGTFATQVYSSVNQAKASTPIKGSPDCI